MGNYSEGSCLSQPRVHTTKHIEVVIMECIRWCFLSVSDLAIVQFVSSQLCCCVRRPVVPAVLLMSHPAYFTLPVFFEVGSRDGGRRLCNAVVRCTTSYCCYFWRSYALTPTLCCPWCWTVVRGPVLLPSCCWPLYHCRAATIVVLLLFPNQEQKMEAKYLEQCLDLIHWGYLWFWIEDQDI